jgi:hypothetical protein
MYQHTAPQFMKMLSNLASWLEKTEAHAKSKEVEVGQYLNARLIADQYDLIEQVQSACDAAKFCCARLTGKEAPKHADEEKTIGEVRDRIKKCIGFLETLKESDFKGCETRQVTLPYLENKSFAGELYAVQMAIPNFYFHVMTAYSILRSNGVPVGKMDYIGAFK